MSYNIINIEVDNIHKNRHFCVEFNKAIVKYINDKDSPTSEEQHLYIIHENKEVAAGVNKDLQKIGNQNVIYKSDSFIETPTIDFIEDSEIFLLHDDAGHNYMHFFHDMFTRCYYFEKLLETKPNLKLGISENYYQEEGRSNFVKQWLDFYLKDKNIELVIFENEKNYQVNKLVLSNLFYWFPEQYGIEPVLKFIKKVSDKIPPIPVKSKGAYISRQDTIKRGWYHGRELINEKEFINKLINKLNYDIIELMDYNIIEKIQIFKSYQNIIQQTGASNFNILFASPESNSIIMSNPIAGGWTNAKCYEFAKVSMSNLLLLDNIGEAIIDPSLNILDKNNYPWSLTNIEGLIEVLCQIDNDSVWES